MHGGVCGCAEVPGQVCSGTWRCAEVHRGMCIGVWGEERYVEVHRRLQKCTDIYGGARR